MKVSGYDDMLSQVKGLPCVGFVMFGSYQGEWVGLLDSGDSIELWKGCYGSCSGCDFIESIRDYDSDEIPDDKVIEYFKEEKAFLSIPKNIIETMTEKDFDEIFPANIRKDIYDFEDGKKRLFEVIKSVKV